MLYMFQAVPPPTIRRSKTVYTASGICKLFVLLTAGTAQFQLTRDSGTQKKLDKYPMLCIQFLTS
jgi:hypothetical protein